MPPMLLSSVIEHCEQEQHVEEITLASLSFGEFRIHCGRGRHGRKQQATGMLAETRS